MALWASADAGEWAAVWARYRDVVASVQKENLVELDEWIQTTLPVVLHERDPEPFITQSELVKLMEWKLKKGKWRPSLMKYIENLSAPAVKKASKKALTGLKNGGSLKSTIEALCELKGVGPATASAVLAAYDSNVPFMGDEALEAISHIIGARKYTLGHYLNFATQLAEKAKWLNEQTNSEDSGDEEGASTWSSQRVQLCLYAAAQGTNGGGQKKKSKAVSPKPKATKSKAVADPDGEDESEDTKSSRPMRKRRKA